MMLPISRGDVSEHLYMPSRMVRSAVQNLVLSRLVVNNAKKDNSGDALMAKMTEEDF